MDPPKKPSNLLRNALICLTGTALILATAVTVLLAVIVATKKTESDAKPSDKPLVPWPRRSDSPLGNYSQLAVTADNGICSAIGRQILLEGGNAVDAGIAVVFCVGITDPQSTGIAGGFFMTVYNVSSKSCTIIDAREMAPGKATVDMYEKDPNSSLKGYLAIGVPGAIHGLFTVYKQFGSLPWKTLVEPAIQLCEDGHPVSGALAYAIESEKHFIMAEPTLRSIFVNNQTGLPLVAGDILKRPQLAVTLQRLADSPDPIKEFYQGSIAQTIVNDITSGGGIITMDDMANYTAKVRKPLVFQLPSYGLAICGPPPPSGASVTMAILNILSGYNLNAKSLESFDEAVETFHRIIEAQKFAYAVRSDLGDMDFVADALKVAKQALTEDWANKIRSKITDTAHSTNYYGGDYQKKSDHGTSHINVLDKQGNAVAVTTTINQYFGSQRRSAELGIIYNDEMDDFSSPNDTNGFGFRPTPANYIHPYKRPQSSMSPLVVFNPTTGVVRLLGGASGGSTIISGTAYVALLNLFLGANVKEAVDYPRLHNQLWPNVTKVERDFPPAYIEALKQLGQNFELVDAVGSVSSAVERKGLNILANSDYRKQGGFPAGYQGDFVKVAKFANDGPP